MNSTFAARGPMQRKTDDLGTLKPALAMEVRIASYLQVWNRGDEGEMQGRSRR